MKRVLLLSMYSRLGASSRLRTLQYVNMLERAGVEVDVNSLLNDSYLINLYRYGRRSKPVVFLYYLRRLFLLLKIRKYDLIWIEAEVFPYLPATIERLFALLKVKYVVDYDDAIFHKYDLSRNHIVRKILGSKIDVVMRNASCVIAGNDYLALRAVSAGAPNVVVIPTVVDRDRYTIRQPKIDAEALTIGWIGSVSTQKYLHDIRESLINVCKKYSAKLLLVGASESILESFPGIQVELLSWTEDSEVSSIQRMDVGIMPLQDGPWERGKCGYKLIQYMACGVPVVASKVGANVGIVENGKCGILINTLQEWESALGDLLGNHTLRKNFGHAGRLAVENIYSKQTQVDVLLKALRSCVRSRDGIGLQT